MKMTKISSLLNDDFGNSNKKSLIQNNDPLSMCNTIYVFLKFTCGIGKQTSKNFLIKTEAFFQKQRFGWPSSKNTLGLVSKDILKLVIPDTRP